MSAALELEEVSVSFRGRPVVAGVSLVVSPGQVTALLGPSGCGKSTLLCAINRLHDLDPSAQVRGRVRLGGQDVYDPRVDVLALRRRVGLIAQKPSPFPFSIAENIAFALREHGTPRREIPQRVEESLRAAALWDEVKDRLQHPAEQLSGGQQQRLCIARAVALRPELLLMDEPCAALDPLASSRVESLIASLAQVCSVLVVTHNLAQARRISQRAYLLWSRDGVGYLAEGGDSSTFFSSPKSPEAHAYLSGALG